MCTRALPLVESSYRKALESKSYRKMPVLIENRHFVIEKRHFAISKDHYVVGVISAENPLPLHMMEF
jgi:hypothetical protein